MRMPTARRSCPSARIFSAELNPDYEAYHTPTFSHLYLSIAFSVEKLVSKINLV